MGNNGKTEFTKYYIITQQDELRIHGKKARQSMKA
jgi:hypothetical protein